MSEPTPVIYRGASSAECVKSFFDLHIGYTASVLDLTYGKGTFWAGWHDPAAFPVITNDKNGPFTGPKPSISGVDYSHDFRATPLASRSFDVVVFDPPFKAGGPPSDGKRDSDRYGATRDQPGAPQDVHDVRGLLAGGLVEAMRLSKKWVLLKTMDVVESGRLWDNVGLSHYLFRSFGFYVIDQRLYDGPRRNQSKSDAARGAKQRHFKPRPSVFYLAKRGT